MTDYRSTILNVDLPAFAQVFAVKVFGAVSMTRSFGPLLIKAKGTICNMGSTAPYFRSPILMAYAGANSALEYLSHQMRMELDPFGGQCCACKLSLFEPSTLRDT